MKIYYKEFSDEKLEEKIKEILIMIQQTYGFVKKGDKKRNPQKLRIEIARIQTEQSRRRNENHKN